jgi:hypothetical protein
VTDTNVAAGAVAEAIASVPVAAPAVEATPMDPSDAARQLSQWRHQKNKQPEAQPVEAAPEVQDSDPLSKKLVATVSAYESDFGTLKVVPNRFMRAREEAPAEADAPEPAEELPPIDAPRSWTPEEKERFKTYPRELQAYLSEREQERDRGLQKRLQEAAERAKAVEAEVAQAQRARQEYEAKLPQVLELMQTQMAGEFPDIKSWADVQKLAADDPFRYSQWQAKQAQLNAMKQEQSRAGQLRQMEIQQAWTQFAQAQDKAFAEKAPEITDPAKATKLRESAVSVLRDTGFSDQELDDAWKRGSPLSLRDHRLQLLILDAVKYRDAKATAAKALPKPIPPVQKPGTAPDKGAQVTARIGAAAEKLKTARGNDAIEAAAEMLRMQRRARR